MVNKLKNNRGVTILMALLFLLLAIVISCIVITAVITAVKTLDQDRGQQQAYLNVSSAVELVKREIVGTRIRTVTTETFDSKGNSKNDWKADPPVVEEASESMRRIWEEIAPQMKHRGANQPPNPVESRAFFIESTVGDVTSQVKVTLVVSYVELDQAFTFQVVATLENMDERYPCRIRLTMSANASVSDDHANKGEDQSVQTITTTYIWTDENVVISKGTEGIA